MRSRFSWTSTSIWVLQGAVFLAATLAQYIFWSWIWKDEHGAIPISLMIAGLLISTVACWAAGVLVRIWRQQQELRQRLDQSEGKLNTMRTFLGGSLRMDTELQDAVDERKVMETALGVIADLVGARGASFVPLDEWGQSLPATVYGKLPLPLLNAWTEHLTASPTRQACRVCQKHHALAGDACPLSNSPFESIIGIHCFPLQRGGRTLGMVNLYLPGKPQLDDEVTDYLLGLLNEAALAVESIRLRNREMGILHQVQGIRAPRADLSSLLQVLMEGLTQALEVDGAQLSARSPAEDQLLLETPHGKRDLFALPAAEELRRRVIAAGRAILPGTPSEGDSSLDERLAGFPLRAPDGRVLGVVLLASETPLQLDERRRMLLQTVTEQATLLIEIEREMLTLEYRTVIQERARLAREIHDGLAQTLAFLKLQAAQMQIYLSQGNLDKLAQVLKQNHETLSNAYLDARQAIDDLRLAPREGFTPWLEQLLAEFETASGLSVERSIQDPQPDLSPEVQAQVVRIVQEALNNIRKHAGAGHVSVSLRRWNGDTVLEVSDDGRGFSPEDIPGISQYGLRGMRERAELIGAEFQVISKPHQGTTVRLSLPVNRQETVP